MESQPTSTAVRQTPSDASDLSEDALCRIFADARRRAVLRVLAAEDDAIEIDALAEAVVDEACDADAVGDRLDRTVVSLYHQHLPLLADNGLLEMNRRDDGVFVRPNRTAITALL